MRESTQSGDTQSDDLKALHGKRIYFGHQSVGANILQGLREFGGDCLPVEDTLIGKNGEPESKCEDFARNVKRIAANGTLDIALMKFCYIDFNPASDVALLFRLYSGTLDDLQAGHPETIFIPITAPLTTVDPLWKRTVKGVLRRPDLAEQANLKRLQFNALLLAHYRSRPIFDLARIEAGSASGRSLLLEYTDDGGHLNRLGSRKAAKEFVHVMACALR